jgi:hypothetical protein
MAALLAAHAALNVADVVGGEARRYQELSLLLSLLALLVQK